MALGCLGLKYAMGKRMVFSSPSFLCESLGEIISTTPTLRRLCTVVPVAAVVEKPDQVGGGEVVVCKGENKLGLFPKRRRPTGFWTSHHLHRDEDSVPADIYSLYPSGLWDALMQASKNVNKLLEKLPPSELIGRVNEQDDRYELRYEVPPRWFKEDVEIRIDYDFILTLKAERKKGEEEGCSVRLVLPEDAKVDEIKAQMENQVLVITIPRSGGGHKGDVKEIQTH